MGGGGDKNDDWSLDALGAIIAVVDTKEKLWHQVTKWNTNNHS